MSLYMHAESGETAVFLNHVYPSPLHGTCTYTSCQTQSSSSSAGAKLASVMREPCMLIICCGACASCRSLRFSLPCEELPAARIDSSNDRKVSIYTWGRFLHQSKYFDQMTRSGVISLSTKMMLGFRLQNDSRRMRANRPFPAAACASVSLFLPAVCLCCMCHA